MNTEVQKLTFAFTLVELLVTLGIVALLTAIMVPVFASARQNSKKAACLSNLRQIYTACVLYAEDADGFVPPYTSQATGMIDMDGTCVEQSRLLLDVLHPYLKSQAVWHCPSDTNVLIPGALSCSLPITGLTSYHYAGYHLIPKGIEPILLDYKGVRFTPSTRSLVQDSVSCPGSDGAFNRYNHGGRWNIIFLDGHAASIGVEDCR